VNTLRRTLYLQSAVWAVVGAAMVFVPRFVQGALFSQAGRLDLAWVRILGLQGFGLAMLMVLVAHRAQDLWWWTWALALTTVGTAVVAVLHAAFGLSAGEPALAWWLLSTVAIGFSLGLLSGLYLTGREYEPR
jgi:hypothetical protein